MPFVEYDDTMELMAIDPMDPAVHDVCLLSEACDRMLARLGKPGDRVMKADGQADAA